METDSLLLCPVRRKKNLMMMKKGWKKKERKKKRIITRFASCETLHPSSFHPVKQTVSYANCHARTQWNWIRANDPVDDFVPRFSLSLSLLYPQLPFSPSPLKNEKFVSKRFERFHRGSTRLSGNLSWCRSCGAALPIQTTGDGTKKEKENKKKNSRGIACNGFTNNRKKDVNEKSNWIFALYENTHGEYTL